MLNILELTSNFYFVFHTEFECLFQTDYRWCKFTRIYGQNQLSCFTMYQYKMGTIFLDVEINYIFQLYKGHFQFRDHLNFARIGQIVKLQSQYVSNITTLLSWPELFFK